MTKYDRQVRLSLACDGQVDESTITTVEEWTQRARALASYVKTRLPPELPPITTYISSIEDNDTDGARIR